VSGTRAPAASNLRVGRATLIHADAFDWMREREPHSIQAIVTDPPYGLLEYSDREQAKLRRGRGGVWRIPPAFDGNRRAPLPRFTVLSARDRAALHDFFLRFGASALRVTVPGAQVLVASNPLLVHVVANAMASAGLEIRRGS
jgi:tRNA G10  N-methylase Trm11